MTSPTFSPVAESARRRAERAEAIKRGWQDGQRPDAAAALAGDPELAGDRAVALDLAYEEFCAREESGEALDAAAFCARFPFGASLHRLLDVHRFLDDHPDALDGLQAPWPAPGESVGDFFLLRELGRGSFARVYLAVETTVGERPVALKISAGGREAATLGPLSHPHLIPVLSSRRAGAWTAVAMPFVGTATLEDVLSVAWPAGAAAPRSAAALLDAAARGRLPDDPPFPACPAYPVDARATYEKGIAAVAVGLFAAVAYLHERGIAHRDIKPTNVLLGPNAHPYLLDFNLASHADELSRPAGTIPYMAPEQLDWLTNADTEPPDGNPGDVFACGVVLYELLTGRHPFGCHSSPPSQSDRNRFVADLLAAHRGGAPDPGALNPRLSSAVRGAVRRCLAYDPRERPTAAELVGLFSPRHPRRPGRFALALAGAAVALVLAYFAAGKPAPVPDAPPVVDLPAPTSPLERGLLLYRQGEHLMAAGEFEKVGKAANDGQAYEYAAYCLSAEKSSAGAIKAADHALKLGHQTAAVYANRAYNYYRTKRLAEAKADCDVALRLDTDLLAARLTRATVYRELYLPKRGGVPDEALADIDRVTAARPDISEAWVIAAELYLLSSGGARLDDAAKAVEKAIAAGNPVNVIRNNPVFRPLAANPIYRHALTLPPGRTGLSVDPRIVNPIP